MATGSTAQAILGAGKVQLAKFNAVTQAFGAWSEPLGADRFEIQPDSEEKQKTSKGREDYGQAIASVSLPKPTKLTIVISAADKDAMAMQFQGELGTVSQPAGPIDVVLTARLGQWVPIGVRNIEATAFTIKVEAGTGTAFKPDIDYAIDWAAGEVKALPGGAISEGMKIKVTGNAAALTIDRIRGGVTPKVRARARFVGVNLVDDSPLRITVWEAQLRSTQGFDVLADDFNGITLEGTCVKPSDKSEAYIVEFDRAATA